MFKGILSIFPLPPCFIWSFPHGCLLLLPLSVFGLDLLLHPCPKAAVLRSAHLQLPLAAQEGKSELSGTAAACLHLLVFPHRDDPAHHSRVFKGKGG